MTSSRTVLIEPNRLFREGLKHLLAGTHFAVEMEFSTTESALAHKGVIAETLQNRTLRTVVYKRAFMQASDKARKINSLIVA